ncbi:MAG: trigger factor [Acidobacteria bacterium]|nr:trigger factor [Acidobacteriota bacterium]
MTNETCKREIEITVPLDEVEQQTGQVVADLQKKVRLPGFRPGKAPASLIRSRYREEIRHEVIEKLLPKAFYAQAERQQLKVVGRPGITNIQFQEGEPLRFKAEFEVAPEVEMKDYGGLEVAYDEPSVTDEEINQRLEQIREHKAEFVNEDPRPLADGDFAVVGLRSIAGVEGKPVSSDEMVLHIGDPDTLPEFNSTLLGLTPGDEREIEVTYPADYGQERLAGRTVTFHVTVKGIRRKELPELDDDFARDLGDYQNLEELREAVRKSLFAEKEFAAQAEAKNALVDDLVRRQDFAVPEAYVERQIEHQMEQYLRSLAAKGIDARKLDLDWQKLRESQRERAVHAVKASLILERIAEAETIYATQEEVDREVHRIAKQEREPAAAVRIRLEKDGSLGRIASHIRTEKTLNFLFERARKVPTAAG